MTVEELIDLLSTKDPSALVLYDSPYGPVLVEGTELGLYFSEGMDTDFVPEDEIDDELGSGGQPAILLN